MSLQITLGLPSDFVTPKALLGASPEDTALILTLGSSAFETLHLKAMESVRSETHTDAISKATEAVQLVADQQLKKIRQEKQAYEEALQVAKSRVEALEQGLSAQRAQIQKEARESMTELIDLKDRQIQDLQSRQEQTMLGVTSRLESLQSSITKTFSSSKEKGTFGEMFVEGMLKKAFDCDINVVSKDAQTADIRMIRPPDLEYFWEVKNYTRMVTTEEVEKFRRDIRLHPAIRAGILVSLRTGIVGRSRGGDIDVEFLEDGRSILFLSNFLNRDDPVFYLQTLRPFFQLLEALTKPAKNDSDTVRALEAKGALIANLLRTHSASVAKHRNSLISHRKRMDNMFAEFSGYVMESETQLQALLRVAVGSDEDVEQVASDAETFLPSLVYTKERLSDLEGRTKAFITWLLSATEVREGTQIEIKELLEKGKEKGFSEKFVRESRDELFQPAAWARGSRYILGLRWLS